MANIFTDFYINPQQDYYLVDIVIQAPPYKTEYRSGENFDPTGMEVTAIYSNNSRRTLTDGGLADGKYEYWTWANLPTPNPPVCIDTMTQIEIGYTEGKGYFRAFIPITVMPVLTGIEITTMPDKTSYFYNETIDITGMVVTASYSDGHTAVVTNYVVSPNTVVVLGSAQILVAYAEYEKAYIKEVPITVQPVVVEVPEQTGTLTYNGSPQSPIWSGYDLDTLTISGDTSKVEAGDYIVSFTPRYGYSWSDGSTSAKEVNWLINRAKITTVPSQSNTLTYTGSSQSPTWNNYNSSQLTLGGTTAAVNVGSYSVEFTPTDNYCWSDGTITAKSVSWSIGKATPTLTLSTTNVNLDNDISSITITVTTNSTGALSVSSSDTSIATATISDKTITVTAIESGSAIINVSLAADSNFNSKSTTVNVEVNLVIQAQYAFLPYIQQQGSVAIKTNLRPTYTLTLYVNFSSVNPITSSSFINLFGGSTYKKAYFSCSQEQRKTSFDYSGYGTKYTYISSSWGQSPDVYYNIGIAGGDTPRGVGLGGIVDLKKTSAGWTDETRVMIGGHGIWNNTGEMFNFLSQGADNPIRISYVTGTKYAGSSLSQHDINYVPVIDTKTGKCGLLDIVNNEFLGTYGSGSFVPPSTTSSTAKIYSNYNGGTYTTPVGLGTYPVGSVVELTAQVTSGHTFREWRIYYERTHDTAYYTVKENPISLYVADHTRVECFGD